MKYHPWKILLKPLPKWVWIPLLLISGYLVWDYHRLDEHPNSIALIQAIDASDIGKIKALLDQGSSPNAYIRFSGEACYPLQRAYGKGKPEVIALLKSRGAHFLWRDPDAVWYAVRFNDAVELKRLIRLRKSIDSKMGKNQQTPLHLAAIDGHADVARVLIDNGVDVNAGDYSNSTPLHYACDKNAGKDAQGSIPVVQMLLENGANPSLPNRDGLTPLGLAKKKKSTEIEAAIQDFLRQKSAKDHR